MWCELCQRWETEVEWTRRHARPLTPKEEAEVRRALKRERRVPPPRPRAELCDLAEKVRQLRKALGLSQAAFARDLGVKVLAVKRWEAGKVRPRQKILKRLEELEGSNCLVND